MRAAIIALMLMIGSQAGADVWDPNNFKLEKVRSIEVVLNDNTKSACWTNLKEVREYAEEKLRIKGARIDNDAKTWSNFNTYTFIIQVNSTRLYMDGSGPCYGNVNAEIYTIGSVNGSMHILIPGSYNFIAASATNFNQTVIETVSAFIAEFK
jgi:hypothetical protein